MSNVQRRRWDMVSHCLFVAPDTGPFFSGNVLHDFILYCAEHALSAIVFRLANICSNID